MGLAIEALEVIGLNNFEQADELKRALREQTFAMAKGANEALNVRVVKHDSFWEVYLEVIRMYPQEALDYIFPMQKE